MIFIHVEREETWTSIWMTIKSGNINLSQTSMIGLDAEYSTIIKKNERKKGGKCTYPIRYRTARTYPQNQN